MSKRGPVADIALGDLCSQWSKPLRRYLQSRGAARPCDIDDISQEAFLRLLRYSSGIKIRDPLGYLYRVACNVANEWHERAANRMPHVPEEQLDVECDEGARPECIVEQEKRDDMVRAAIEQLPQRSRRVIQLQIYSDLTYSQIADQLGISYRVVLRELVRAHAELRMALGAPSRM